MSDDTRIARMKQKAWSMLDANQPDEALAAFRECVELEPGNLNHQIELGVALYKLGKSDECLFSESIPVKKAVVAGHDDGSNQDPAEKDDRGYQEKQNMTFITI